MSSVKIHTDIQQGSTEWYRRKCGLPSASNAGMLMTPSGRPSKSSEAYLSQLVAERILGFNEAELDDMVQTFWMERGHDLEDRARAAYEMQFNVEVKQAGGLESRGFWASPDGLLYHGDVLTGGVEIKCPAPKKHVQNWRYVRQHGTVPPEYAMQMRMSMIVAGVNGWQFVSFCPGFPLVTCGLVWDDMTNKLQALTVDFAAELDATVATMESELEI